ncbi:MAG: CehA/McbA family metallohydrolase [Sedimentisphaerales bacterium]|nr:CehA/McbA family metallohydrolase [Sedimentisphaerales bacterium]
MKIRWLVFVAAVVVIAGMTRAVEQKSSKLVNPFEVEGTWYKTNLHTHTNLSDGDVNLPIRVKQYRDKGYQVLAITDHEKTNTVTGYSDANFLLISGMETHPKSGMEVPYHFVCVNVPAGFHRSEEMSAQQVIDAVKAAGGEVIYAHPYWCGHTINQLTAVEGYIGVEVFNGVCGGKGYSAVYWDELLGAGRILPAVAADDAHTADHIRKGWIMIKAKELTPDAIMNSLRNGGYYASCGPTIEDFRLENGVVKLKCSAVTEIHLFGQAHYYYDQSAKKGSVLTGTEYKLPNGFKYVRAEVIDADGKHAWTNPIEIKK